MTRKEQEDILIDTFGKEKVDRAILTAQKNIIKDYFKKKYDNTKILEQP